MSELKATLINVGWGDSIFVETDDANGNRLYALIDSNDTSTLRSSYIFIRRYLDREYFRKGETLPPPSEKRMFDWVLLTHGHADHAQGLKRLLREFGCNQFWFPNTGLFDSSVTSSRPIFVGSLMRCVMNSSLVEHYDWIDESTILPDFGSVRMKVLWPPPGHKDDNENNNSVVLAMTLGKVSFVFTGDAEADVWNQPSPFSGLTPLKQIPKRTMLFKHPHHGSKNGMFEALGSRTPWLNVLGHDTRIAISSHVRPFSHPSLEVVEELSKKRKFAYRTDEHHHITVTTDGSRTWVDYSHR